jgi:ABC-type spermidine/putrescine transport system permease subunit I
MSGDSVALRPLSPAEAPASHDPTPLLLLPAMAMLVLMFFVPMVLFFVRTFMEFPGSGVEFVAQARGLLFSQPYLAALATTNWIALTVTVAVLLVGYPIAYYLTTATGPSVSVVVLAIVLPYFTSLIVRTFSWMVLLGEHGLINDTLRAIGVIDAPLPLMYNRLGVLIGMSYVLLPYMVLTLYAAMRGIDAALLRAAEGLGASGFYTFRRVYFPLSLHGVLSGALIVYILSIGYFITPALMGGQHDIMIAMLIDRELEVAVDWPAAALMSLSLLAVTLALYALYYRVTDIRRLIGAR